jgi:hypothetical protein
MKHASPAALARLEVLLAALRNTGTLRERTPGSFYRGGTAYLHFHEDPSGLFADVKLAGAGFTRVAVTSVAQQRELLATVKAATGASR